MLTKVCIIEWGVWYFDAFWHIEVISLVRVDSSMQRIWFYFATNAYSTASYSSAAVVLFRPTPASFSDSHLLIHRWRTQTVFLSAADPFDERYFLYLHSMIACGNIYQASITHNIEIRLAKQLWNQLKNSS